MNDTVSPLRSPCFRCVRRIPVPRPLRIVLALLAMLAAENGNADDLQEKPQSKLPTTVSASITEPDVQDRLQLSDEQRQKIAELHAAENAEITQLRGLPVNEGQVTWRQIQEVVKRFEEQVRSALSPDQAQEWSRLKQLEAVTILGPGREILQEDMRAELGLNETQTEAIDELQKEFCRECERILADTKPQATPGIPKWDSPFMTKVREASAAFDERLEPLLKRTLNPAQQSRWTEIQWQKAASRQGPAVLLGQSIIDYLGLSEAQQQEIRVVSDNTQRQADEERKQRHFAAAMRLPAANLDKALKFLTPAQKRRWESLLGKPFRDRWSQFVIPGPMPGSGPDAK